MIGNLFKPVSDTKDEGIMREDNLFKPIYDTEDEGIMREDNRSNPYLILKTKE